MVKIRFFKRPWEMRNFRENLKFRKNRLFYRFWCKSTPKKGQNFILTLHCKVNSIVLKINPRISEKKTVFCNMQDGLYGEGFWLMDLLFINKLNNNIRISKKQKRLWISCWNGSQPSRGSRRCEFLLHFLVQFLRNSDQQKHKTNGKMKTKWEGRIFSKKI